jgi:Type II intron maturase
MDKRKRYQQRGKSIHRTELLHESDYTIMATYQLEYRGIVNYYRHAYNLHRLHSLKKAMEGSLAKTLAAKHNTSVGSIYRKYRTQVEVDGKTYKALQVTIDREGKKPLVATWGGIPLKWDIKAALDDQPQQIWHDRSELEQRLLAQVCEHCGTTHMTDQIEVHVRRFGGRDRAHQRV